MKSGADEYRYLGHHTKNESHHLLSDATQVQTSVEKRKDTYVAQIDVSVSPKSDNKEVYVSW